MDFVFHDGVRAAAGYKGSTGDCVTRSIAIATGKTHQEIYDALNRLPMMERLGRRKRKRSNSRTGDFRPTLPALSRIHRLALDLDDEDWVRLPGPPAPVGTAARPSARKSVAAPHGCHRWRDLRHP